uniref:Reverse transcriptase zinc-binding domain-containing protein n=1 Tax=Setaria viridis TaxID=4556 RepID=A0A4U6TME0_SETVI|nr:hypothetical protein SEVIR_7G067600v2 [Setaria viridis]
MYLDSYTCEMCILRKRETVADLFLCCNFAKACWASIGASAGGTFFMKIIILMSASIWACRNNWTFNGTPPSVEACKRMFITELSLISSHRARSPFGPSIADWLSSL